MVGLALCIAFLLLFQASSSSHAQTPTRTSHALLIGIADYSGSEGVSSLKAPPKDIALVRDVLKKKFEVPDKNITTLLDHQATHTTIKKAFSDLAASVKEGDFVYIHYSGHGSIRPDKNERGGYDQTWVTYGSRNKNFRDPDNRDVLDKEINLWLQPLYQKARAAENEKKAPIDIVFISDSCHSGTVARRIDEDGVTNIREVKPDPARYPDLSNIPAENSSSLPGVRIGAARDTESAIETCEDPNRCYGVFTWNWVNALKEATPGARWEDVFKRTFTMVTADRGMQRPQLEGHAERPIFWGEFPAPSRTVAVTHMDNARGTVRLDAGSASGVTKGSLYRLYTAMHSKQGEVAELEVIDASEAFTSEAKLRKGTVQVGDLVSEIHHTYQFNPTRLYVSGDFENDVNQFLIQDIQVAVKKPTEFSGFQLVSNRVQADLLLYVLRPKKDPVGQYVYDRSTRQRLPQSFPEQPPEVWVVTPQDQVLHDTMRISFSDKDEGMRVLQKNLRAFAWARQVRQLEAKGATPKVRVQATVARPDVTCKNECLKSPQDGTLHRRMASYGLGEAHVAVKRGDAMTFSLKNEDSQRSWYVYLLDIAPEGTVKAIFPMKHDNEDEALLKKEQVVDLTKKRFMRLNGPGVETIKLIVSSNPIDVRLLKNEEGFEKKGDQNPLERVLKAAGRRRGDMEDIKVEDWGTLQADYEVLAQ